MADEDDSVIGLENVARSPKLALYPIALNGGGTGLYADPREFGGRSTVMEEHYVSGRNCGRRGNVRFASPADQRRGLNDTEGGPIITTNNVKNREEEEGMDTIDLEAQMEEPWIIQRASPSRLSLSSIDPWRIWTTLHTELSRLAAIRSSRLEDESSHVTLAKQKNWASSDAIARVYNQDNFDFVLVLSPNEAYAFWARYLDFRDEALCNCYDHSSLLDDDASSIVTDQEIGLGDEDKVYTPLSSSGLRRRRNNNTVSPSSNINNNTNLPSKTTTTTAHHTPLFSSMSSAISPGPRPSMLRSSQKRTAFQQKSLFERAVDKFSPTRFSIGDSPKSLSRQELTSSNNITTTPLLDTPERRDTAYSTGGKLRRRWGNQDCNNNIHSTPNLTSPPIVSLKARRLGSATRKTWKGVSSSGKCVSSLRKNRSLFVSSERVGKRGRETMLDAVPSTDENEEDNFFASPGIPRGVGEYTMSLTCTNFKKPWFLTLLFFRPLPPALILAKRINGLDQFLEALEIGIVVRRHWPRGKSVFIQLYSDDKGDTICYRYVPDDEAIIALREQEQRYNGRRRIKKARLSFGINDNRRDSDNTIHNDNLDAIVPLPDYLKAKIDRDEDNRKKGGIKNAIYYSALNWLNAGEIEAKNIVEVHPAIHEDPFDRTKLGTWSLRQSDTKYIKNNTFSIILPSKQGALFLKHFPNISVNLNEKW